MAESRNESGRANRVAPDGSLNAVSARGMYWGNRGQLLDRGGSLRRHFNGRLWIICVLEFNGRHRTQWQPGRLTELYFMDEPTGLAAGHRPCGECRHAAYTQFKEAWLLAHPDGGTKAGDIDRLLHASRIDGTTHVTYSAARDDLPEGTMVDVPAGTFLLWGSHALHWTWDGYDGAVRRSELPSTLTVRTPEPTVAALSRGFRPDPHPSARALVSPT